MSRTSAPTAPYTPLEPGCKYCDHTHTNFGDALGHDAVGHRAHGALLRAGYVSRELLEHATDRELLDVRDLGAVGLARVRTLIPAPHRPARLTAAFASQCFYTPAALRGRLPAGLTVDEQLLESSATAAPLWILTALSRTDPRIWKHVDHAEIHLSAIVREPGWTREKRELIKAAACLASASHARFDLNRLAHALDDERWDALLEALRIRRSGLRGRW